MPGARPVRVTAVACAATVVASLPVFLLGALQVLVADELALGPERIGLLVTCYFAASAVVATPVGRLVQRTGAARGVRAGVVLAAASLAGVALLGASPWLLALALAVGGAANATAQIAANQSLADAVPRARQGIAFAVKQTAIPVATLLAGLAVPAVGLALGWRAAFAVGAVLTLPVLLAVTADVPGVVRRRLPRGERPPRALLVVAAGAGAGAGAANAFGAFLVAAAVDVGVGAGRAGLLLALGSVAGVAGRLAAGLLADRRGRAHLPVVAGQLAVGAAASLLLAAVAAGAPVPLLVPAALAAFGFGWAWPGLLNLAVVRVHPVAPAAATGVTQTGVFAGGALGPLLFGLVVGASGYAAAWVLTALVQVTAAGLVVAGRARLRAGREGRGGR